MKTIRLWRKKDPGFDLYWLAIAMEKTREFPDEIQRWPVEMLARVEAKSIKDRFSQLAKEILAKIRKGT